MDALSDLLRDQRPCHGGLTLQYDEEPFQSHEEEEEGVKLRKYSVRVFLRGQNVTKKRKPQIRANAGHKNVLIKYKETM